MMHRTKNTGDETDGPLRKHAQHLVNQHQSGMGRMREGKGPWC